ncbi:DUF4347 domain-containing protein [Crateriforma spongiae]|uniref:DUF4347 domain-containing protein n=1 Tax=Crateriforma spongiae TaxID=2724528 RepID=UPI0039AF876A
MNRPASRSVAWSLASLEPRTMLAADAGIACASSASSPAPVDVGTVADTSRQAPTDLVLIDSSVELTPAIADAVPAGADLILISDREDGLSQITTILRDHQGLRSLHLISHAGDGSLRIGSEVITEKVISDRSDEIASWSDSFAHGGDLVLYGCDLAAGQRGDSFLRQLASLTSLDVAASTNRTGGELPPRDPSIAQDWNLEWQLGHVETIGLLDRDSLRNHQQHLGITIWAAGSTGDELMELQVGDEIVDTWFVRNTDADNDQFLPFFYNVDGISANDVRINFVNDAFDPASGIDRNLRIDRIEIDGRNFEAESPWVYSQGVYVDGIGVTEGSFNTEWLVADGYMQFNEGGVGGGPGDGGGGSTITIEAAGDTGDEAMQLLIDGNVVQTYLNVSQQQRTYTYNADQTVTGDRVRVAFIGDVYQPEFGYDQNLRVDRITIDGRAFESESPSTFSTGTFVAGQGIVPGNWQTEYLNSNGYFQYGGTPDPGTPGEGANSPGRFSILPAPFNPSEDIGQITIEVQRIGGSNGAVSVEYYTSDESAIAGQDYRSQSGTLNFSDGESSKFITVDLINDNNGEGTETFAIILDRPVGTTLLAPRTSTITIVDDDNNLPGSPGSVSPGDGINTNGVSWISGGNLNVTGNVRRQVGSAFYETPVAIDSNTSFQAQFQFWIGGFGGATGESGMTFTIQNSPQGSDAIGLYGSWLGYQNISNSVAVEFDTVRDAADRASREISVLTGGDVVTPVSTAVSPYTLNDSREYYAWVDYNAASDKLAVYISDTPNKPEFATTVATVQLENEVGDQAYFGFTAASFDRPNQHVVRNFQLSLDPPAFDPPVRPPFPSGSLVQQNTITGLNQPLALDWSPDGRNLYVAEKGGVVKVQRDGGAVQTVIDISGQVNSFNDRGLVDFAVHPDLQNNPYLYLLYTYDPPEVYNFSGLAGPDGAGNRAGRLMRVTLDASSGYTSVVQGSEQILLGTNSTWDNFNGFIDSSTTYSNQQGGVDSNGNYIRDFINSDSQSHTVGSLAFGIDGNLFVSIGDGAGYTQVDPRATRVQDIDSLSGKVLRIDPITGRGLSDNPFFNGDSNANRSKVFQTGLRNPWRLTVDPTSGQLLIGETGWTSYEEINTGRAGANFGWPYFEGRQGVNQPTPQYSGLPGASDFYNNVDATAPVIAITHGAAGDAIVLGGYINGSDLGEYFDDTFFYNNAYEGTVRLFRVDDQGNLTDQQLFTTGAQWVVDIQQAPDGSVYYANLVSGAVGKWEFV